MKNEIINTVTHVTRDGITIKKAHDQYRRGEYPTRKNLVPQSHAMKIFPDRPINNCSADRK